jgi:NADH-quinone oxidoreductase E subunit
MSSVVHVVQPHDFAFTDANLVQAKAIIARYPEGKQASAVMPLLALAQEQYDGWLPRAAMDVVASMLGMAPVRVYEVASFYTMYNLAPTGKHVLGVCTTTPCWLRGSDDIMKTCEQHLGVRTGQTTPDGLFTLREVECLGACVNAPMMQIGKQFYEDLSADSVTAIIDALARGDTPKPGPQSSHNQPSRRSSEPAPGLTSLKGKKSA